MLLLCASRPLLSLPLPHAVVQSSTPCLSQPSRLFSYCAKQRTSFLSSLLARNTMSSSYDNIVIGSGQGGTPLASALAAAGQRTALIEAVHVGGTCINVGCTPTKTMVASARVAYLARRGKDYGINFPGNEIKVDMATVRQRKRAIVESFRTGSERRLKSAENLDWITGTASFVSPTELEISTLDSKSKVISGNRIFINVGGYPAPLTIPGASEVPVLNSTTIMELDVVPDHLIVIGGGYVGCEFAQMFRRFGAKVTIIQRGAQLLGREDDDVAEGMRDILLDDGIEIYFSADAESVVKSKDGGVELVIRTANGSVTLDASHLLAAAGRLPNTGSALNLKAAGVEVNSRGFIKCDAYFKTTTPHIYALGDCVADNLQFTHVSYDDFRILKENLLDAPAEQASLKTTVSSVTGTGSLQPESSPRPFDPSSSNVHGVSHESAAPTPKRRSRNDRVIPYTVFTDPQLGRIGPTLSELESSARASTSASSLPNASRYWVSKMPMAYVARALEMDESRGFMKIITDSQTDKIVSAAILGLEGGEVMTMLQMAMLGGLKWEVLRDAVFAHPGLGESLNNVWRA